MQGISLCPIDSDHALAYLIKKRHGYDMLAYMKDFIDFNDTEHQAQEYLNKLGSQCKELNLELTSEKCIFRNTSLQ